MVVDLVLELQGRDHAHGVVIPAQVLTSKAGANQGPKIGTNAGVWGFFFIWPDPDPLQETWIRVANKNRDKLA